MPSSSHSLLSVNGPVGNNSNFISGSIKRMLQARKFICIFRRWIRTETDPFLSLSTLLSSRNMESRSIRRRPTGRLVGIAKQFVCSANVDQSNYPVALDLIPLHTDSKASQLPVSFILFHLFFYA